MFRTTNSNSSVRGNITVSTETLAEMLDCGKVTAKKIGTAAGAKIQIGRRVLWNSEKIKAYLNTQNLSTVD